MTSGKRIRLRRLIDPVSNSYILIALDHGVTLGPIKGLKDINSTVKKVTSNGATGIIIHKGILRHIETKSLNNASILAHLSGSVVFSKKPDYKLLMGTVEDAVSMGVDAISIHVNLGNDYEDKMLLDLSKVSSTCQKLGFPLLAMMYIRKNGLDPFDPELIAHAAHLADEIGADIVKVDYTGSISSFEDVIQGCQIPVLIAGGVRKSNFSDFLIDVQNAILAGAEGVSVGRNIFQADNVELHMNKLLETVRRAKEERDGFILTTTI